MFPHVDPESPADKEPSLANRTAEWSLSSVSAHVEFETRFGDEPHIAQFTAIGPLSSMVTYVYDQVASSFVHFVAE